MIEYTIKVKRKTKSIFRDGWVWTMAWRDARQNFSRLMLFAASLVTGIAAVVAISSLNYSLKEAIDENAKELLGADLVVDGNRKFEKEVVAAFDSTKLDQSSQTQTTSMVMFMNNGQSRLVQVLAMAGNFPYYGKIVTAPEDAYEKMKAGRFVMLDESLARQYEVSTGDSVKIGTTKFIMAGEVRKMPGSGGALSTFTPSVYISKQEMDSTGLIQFGSRIEYKQLFKIGSEEETEVIAEKLEPVLRKYGHREDTVAERKEDLGRALKSVYQFFSLLAFVALILGCIGVASSVHIYAREKREEVAVLRCVGSSGWQAFNIYFIQVFILGLIGSIVGSALGVVIQQVIPVAFKDYMPIELDFDVSWQAVSQGILLGGVVSILFTLLPLVSVRFVPPLTVLRADYEPGKIFSKTKMVAIVLIVLFPILSAWYQTGSFIVGFYFSLGLAGALGGLTLVAMFLLFLIRKFFPKNATFIFRHALSNLFRPNNQTRVLMVTIGLGAFIITTMNVIQSSLLGQVEFRGSNNESNTIMFDIQSSQKDGVVKLISDHTLPVNQVVPMVTCRLSEVKGRTIEALLADTANNRRPNRGALRREYRVTYRDSLNSAEKLIKGDMHQLRHGKKDSVWVTIAESFLESLQVDVGDSLVFDVQGVPVKAFISGVRTVEWQKDPPNFIFVFPKGVLDNAPQIWVAATRVDNQQKASVFQRELVTGFPNVSLIDMRLVLATVEELFDKIGLIVKFLASFSIITGLVVLAGAVLNSKFVRIKENVLLRTIGARTGQITKITLIEYAYLGLFAALTGIFLSIGAGWLLAKFFFEVTFSFDLREIGLIGLGVMVLTVFIGWWNSRQVINTPPLQVLRKEN